MFLESKQGKESPLKSSNGASFGPKPSNVDVEDNKEGILTDDMNVCDKTLLCFNKFYRQKSWHRMLLLVIAITVHNIPEGLAVGVAFGAVGKSDSATFSSAKSLALGIGIQNFPECDIRPEWPKCNLCRLRIFSSRPSELMISKD